MVIQPPVNGMHASERRLQLTLIMDTNIYGLWMDYFLRQRWRNYLSKIGPSCVRIVTCLVQASTSHPMPACVIGLSTHKAIERHKCLHKK
jgi:hypothetical protein